MRLLFIPGAIGAGAQKGRQMERIHQNRWISGWIAEAFMHLHVCAVGAARANGLLTPIGEVDEAKHGSEARLISEGIQIPDLDRAMSFMRSASASASASKTRLSRSMTVDSLPSASSLTLQTPPKPRLGKISRAATRNHSVAACRGGTRMHALTVIGPSPGRTSRPPPKI